MNTFAVCVLFVGLGLAPAIATGSGIPDFSLSTASSNPGLLFITPNGNGPTLAAADLVITLELRDSAGSPIANYPFQDMWVDDDGNGDIAMCYQGSLADHNTNASGVTTFSGTFAGGGWTQAGLRVYVAGMPLVHGLVEIDVCSPDFSRDDRVDIVDLGQFAMDYVDTEFDFWCDFNGDGEENLVDLGIFAANHGVLGCSP